MIKKMLTYLIDLLKRLCYSLIRVGDYMGWINMKSKFSAFDIANWFIWKNNIEVTQNLEEDDNYEVYEGISHLKLQKLLYNAQGVYLAFYGKKLFKEDLLAWEHGPVIKEIYNKYKKYGRKNLEADSTNDVLEKIKNIENDTEVSNVLNLVYDNFGIYTAWKLRELSHVAGGPWETTVRTKGLNKEISISLIEDYFKQNIIDNE